MLRVSRSSAWRAQYAHGHTRGSDWAMMKKTRVHLQNLLAYERIEVSKANAKRIMNYTDSLINICKKGPAELSALPEKFETHNHELPFDSHSYAPKQAQFKIGAEFWAYDHVWESDRRFAKTTKDRSQSENQYTRDMLDWWTEGPNQEVLQDKIYSVFLPRFNKKLGKNMNNYCKIALLSHSYFEARSAVDGLPAYKGGGNMGGRFNAGVHHGFYGAGSGRQAVLEITGNAWPPLPLHRDEDQDKHSLENVLLQNALKSKTVDSENVDSENVGSENVKSARKLTQKGFRPRRDTQNLKDNRDSFVF